MVAVLLLVHTVTWHRDSNTEAAALNVKQLFHLKIMHGIVTETVLLQQSA
jgi:hypothetical protein